MNLQSKYFLYLYEVFLCGFIDELIMQLQDEIGPSKLTHPSLALIAAYTTYVKHHQTCFIYRHQNENSVYFRMCKQTRKKWWSHLSACAGEIVELQDTFVWVVSECSQWQVWQCLQLNPVQLCSQPDALPEWHKEKHNIWTRALSGHASAKTQ